jgi:hypothetical protein
MQACSNSDGDEKKAQPCPAVYAAGAPPLKMGRSVDDQRRCEKKIRNDNTWTVRQQSYGISNRSEKLIRAGLL